MKILITNDDGIESAGIRYLWDALKDHSEVWIVAPNKEQSGVGMGSTYMIPLSTDKVTSFGETPAWKVGGTPSDCVKLGVTTLMPTLPDLIVSGVNHGSNAGRTVLYSGTIGGVIEGVFRGIPGVAFSYDHYDYDGFDHLKHHIRTVIDHVIEHPLPKGSFLNVNFPHTSDKEFRGYKMARQGKAFWSEKAEYEHHPELGYTPQMKPYTPAYHEEEPNSDIALLKQGYITAVPIHVNEMTDHDHLDEKSREFDGLA